MKRIGIEALLAWAYRQELPKAGSGTVRGHAGPGAGIGGWDMVADYGELLALIDTSNAWGCVPDFGIEDYPHEDAVTVGQAVAALADASFEPAPDYDVLADLVLEDGSLLTVEERDDCHVRGLAIARINEGRMPATVVRMAMLGAAPGWTNWPVARKRVSGANGRDVWVRLVTRAGPDGEAVTVEMDGYDRQRQRPYPGAVLKTRLTPDPVQLVVDRVEYQAWVLALGALVADLDGKLTAHALDGLDCALWPWEGEAARVAPRVLLAGKAQDARTRGSCAA
ncbi:hypothetical protein GTW51_14880 [Aurantimonas aggregata]|uniref:Uncharacterized protein n=1 Tax=Aurantimonas aggregata TaxID=2047720 RepID=A0A6L9MJJ3_9HYPH|nr:hypothetical protein [Aurantimonas aggregata]NDV87987.1 hypothetical protein [Aurantimonas aggregata]